MGPHTFEVTGERIERLVHMTKLEESESLRYLHRRLERIGVLNKLRDLGVMEGDTVRIAGWEFSYEDW
jgi:GTP-binding protein